jgi:hypothetical protein
MGLKPPIRISLAIIGERLKNYLRDLGVTSAEDLCDCEEKWIENITKLVKPLPLRQLNRFLGRETNDS